MSDDGRSLRRNPFRPLAIANVSLIGNHPDDAEVSVETSATRAAFLPLREYLARADGQSGDGVTIMVSGEYGTGKTHLLVRMLDHALEQVDEPIRALYLVPADGPESGFLGLFRRFLDKVTKDELVRQINLYYADEFAQVLNDADLPAPSRSDLSDVSRLARWYDVSDSSLIQRVTRTLADVTSERMFSVALTLLLHPKREYEHAVWSWLKGEPPAQGLRDRRIDRRIDDDVVALDTLAVFALILGGRNRRFVLAIDEMSEIFANSKGPSDILMEGLRHLLEVAGDAGACFILSGLPDLVESLAPKVRERISYDVKLGGLTEDEIVEFVLRSHAREYGVRRFAPFADGTEHTVWDITRGNARQVVRLLHHVCLLAAEGLPEDQALPSLTDDWIYRAAYDSAPPTLSTVTEDVWRIARRNGWLVREEQTLPGGRGSRVEFSISSRRHDAHCAVLVMRALLTREDTEQFEEWVEAIRAMEPRRAPVVVTLGLPSNSAIVAARGLLGTDPIVRRSTFDGDLTSALGSVLHDVTEADPSARLSQQISELTRMVGAALPKAHGLDVRLIADEVSRQVTRSVSRLIEAARDDPAADVDRLPDVVSGIFDRAERSLGELLLFEARVAEAFERGGYDAAASLLPLLTGTDVRRGLGAVVTLTAFLRQFRRGVALWFDTSADESALNEVCDVFEAMADRISLTELASLTVLEGLLPERIGAQAPVAEAMEAMERLAERVRDAAIRVTAGDH